MSNVIFDLAVPSDTSEVVSFKTIQKHERTLMRLSFNAGDLIRKIERH